MFESLLTAIISVAIAVYVFRIWLADYRAKVSGSPNEGAIPGASPASQHVTLIAVVGALVILGVESGGEIALGVSDRQSDIAATFLLTMIAAGIIEEVVFRGYLVIEKRGRPALIASCVGFSLLFTLGHVQYWMEWHGFDAGWFSLKLNTQSCWTLLMLFVNSLWFYAVRFMPANRERSLIPCYAAHIASNLGVFAVKLAQGHVTTWL